MCGLVGRDQILPFSSTIGNIKGVWLVDGMPGPQRRLAARPTPDYPEVGFGEVTDRVPEADFWVPVTRTPSRGSWQPLTTIELLDV